MGSLRERLARRKRAVSAGYRPVGYAMPTLLAVGLHLLVLIISVISLPLRQADEPESTSIVQATLVSTETTTDQAQRAEEARARAAARQAEEEARQAEEEQARAEAEREAAEAEQQAAREAEELQRQAEREAAEADAQRRAEEAERLAQQREEQEAERQAEAQRRAEEEARQREAEEQRQREAEEQRQREAEEQRRREEEARRAAEAAAAGLDRAIEGESEAVANARQAQEAANSFINLVRRAVEQAWVIPPGASGQLNANVQVQLGPSGELFGATITQSSGDSAFDRSALQAVEAAAPFGELRQLPPMAQRDFRQFNLRFSPGDVR
ncbi:MAG TPA: cell envelope integrity protein TolA [Candidatus Halomonas stercoripullorum]|uniref:Cell envelope integrity protein TolA n=1 Tax=Candidatus Halomonas stercoripullorum TaxID=2838617 RepID=A0A9D1WLZ6_9GAMM|nr:cell envelope integrity protein TolA [Candidatus Halomonas stercoripullorum]